MKLKNEICQLILCIWLIPSITLADGLFPTMSQMFGTAMPSIGLAIQRNADERLTADGSTSEKYNGFGEEEYLSFGRYLAGAGAVLDDYSVEDTVMTAAISARGASMTLVYDWVKKSVTAIYPEGTRVEMEKEAVKETDSILPPVGGILPSAEFAVNRKPMMTEENDGGILQVYKEFTDEDYTAYNAYLGETGATLQSSSLERGVLNAEVLLDGFSFRLVYDWNRQVLQVNYPKGTKPETKKWNVLCDEGPVLPDVTALGKELPSISQGILREPDTVKELSDGGKEEVYTEFEEADYEAFSRYLQTAECTVKEYHVDANGALVISLENRSGELQFIYNQMEHTGTAVYPGVQRIEVAWTPTPTPVPTPTPQPTPTKAPNYSEEECWRRAEEYFRDWANKNLKNPQSLIINSHTMVYDDGSYKVVIDYSAQNGFGGYNRDEYYVVVSHWGGVFGTTERWLVFD